MHRFLIVIERAGENYSSYAPDLPGCVAAGDPLEEVEGNMHDAIRMHIRGLQEDGLPIPRNESLAEYLAV